MHRIFALIITTLLTSSAIFAADPTHTNYSWSDCQGSAKPYPVPTHPVEHPDSLTPVMINHIGRHGSRFPASPKHSGAILTALRQADSAGTITPRGRELMNIVETLTEYCAGRWGSLDSLGMAEQRGIASRMYASYPMLFTDGKISAISSYAPRCIMSMYEFTHQLARLDNKIEINTSSGRQYSHLLRFFDDNTEYREFIKSDTVTGTIKDYMHQNLTATPLKRILGDDYDLGDNYYDLAMAEYSMLAGIRALNLNIDINRYLTPQEYNAMWRVANLQQYLRHSSSTLSSLPTNIAAPLLNDMIDTTDRFIASEAPMVNLRFGHAETLMPLLSLMRLRNCHYLTNYFDTVGLNWHNFHIVPMASNLQIILFKSVSGRYYIRVDLNETPIPLIPNDSALYTDWNRARDYLIRCLPLDY